MTLNWMSTKSSGIPGKLYLWGECRACGENAEGLSSRLQRRFRLVQRLPSRHASTFNKQMECESTRSGYSAQEAQRSSLVTILLCAGKLTVLTPPVNGFTCFKVISNGASPQRPFGLERLNTDKPLDAFILEDPTRNERRPEAETARMRSRECVFAGRAPGSRRGAW